MWLPLESNPDVMNRYITSLGIPEPKLEFVDVYGVSEDLLAMVPSPVHAVMLVYPINEATEQRTKELVESQTDEVALFQEQHRFFFTRQYVGNACGTIAMAHAVFNNLAIFGDVAPGSFIDDFSKFAAGCQDPAKIGEVIAASKGLASAHATAANEGATEHQPIDTDINLHFVCLISVGGRCVELDGRKKNPVLHGQCHDSDSFLRAAAAAIQEKMDLNPGSYEFGITALVEKQP